MWDKVGHSGRQEINDSEADSEAAADVSGDTPPAEAFRGNFLHNLDEKNRVSLPAPFRETISRTAEYSVVLTNFITDGARCLDGFPLASWASFEARLRERSRFDPQLRKLENFYLARAAVSPVDANGRILVPPHLRTYAGLEKEVVFTASLHGFRMWDKRVWDLVFQEAEAALLENPALFVGVDVQR